MGAQLEVKKVGEKGGVFVEGLPGRGITFEMQINKII